MISDIIRTENVFLFVPNLIGKAQPGTVVEYLTYYSDSTLPKGYARIVLAVISFWFMPTNYVIAGSTYLLSVFLDCLDGHAARYFNQCECIRILVLSIPSASWKP